MATRTIGTDIKLTGEKEFNAGMKAMNSNLKTLRTDMAAVSAEFGDNANSMEALTAKQKVLQQSVDQHKAKVDALRQKYEQVKDLYGENSAQADKYKQQLNQATVALHKETEALEKNADALKEVSQEKLKAIAAAAKSAFGGMGTAAAAGAKGIGMVSAASMAAVAGLGALGAVGLKTMAGFAMEAAEAARAAQEAGEPLTQTQQQWLSFANSLDGLEASSARAKSAMGMILLPALRDLSTEGADLLDSFARDMEAAANSPEQQGKIMADYIVKAAQMLREKIPEYVQLGKELVSGLGDGLRESGPELIDMGADLAFDLLDGIIDNAPAMADAGMMLMQRFIQSLIDRGPDAVASGADMVEQIILGLAQNAPALIPAAGKLILELAMALLLASPDLLAAGGELVLSIVEGFINMLGLADDAGAQVVSHIKNGIAKAWDSLVSWFDGIWNSLFNRSVDVDVNGSGGGSNVDGSHASGLDYVPFDGYLAKLHKGEMVLNSFDADRYRTSKGATTTKVVNLTINAKSLTSADIDMVIDEVNRKLGEDL